MQTTLKDILPFSTNTFPIAVKARHFAQEWHGDQRYGDLPYVTHLDEVAAILIALDAPDWQVAAAYLHDILEDTKAPPHAIGNTFGAYVLTWVIAVTGVGVNRKEKQASIVRNLEKDTTNASLLKLADRLANVRNAFKKGNTKILAMYKKDTPVLIPLFYAVNPMLTEELASLLDISLLTNNNCSW